MNTKKILITVKTYPNLSKSYNELVCTAGLDEEGNWYRIFPIPFRDLPYSQQYNKYDWIELELMKSKKDDRKESYKLKSIEVDEPIKKIGNIDTSGNWSQRKAIVLEKAKVYTNLDELVALAKSSELVSLAVFKPTKVVDFLYKEEKQRDWPKSKLQLLNQANLFNESYSKKEIVRKLPYKFSYVFLDDSGKKSTQMIEDWEVGALYWKELERLGDEKSACESVKNKFFNVLVKTDLHFFLGTTFSHHKRAPQPFIIIGVFYPQFVPQLSLKFTD